MKNKGKEVGGETDKEREWEKERGVEREKEKQWIRHPLREIIALQILRPKYQRAPQEVGDLTHLWDFQLRRSRQEQAAIMRAIGTKHRLLVSFGSFAFYFNPFFYFTLILPPSLSRSHYELYTVCCSAAERAPFPHRWLFWGAGKLDATVLFLFFLSPGEAGGGSWGELHPTTQ